MSHLLTWLQGALSQRPQAGVAQKRHIRARPLLRRWPRFERLEIRDLLATFAVIGDFGADSQQELDVANLVKSWNPDFVITTGDNGYNTTTADIDRFIGKYYQQYIGNYQGSFGPGAGALNRFFPSAGNHDWDGGSGSLTPYTNYFTLPGNERYYDFVQGEVHFFVVSSDPREPSGRSPDSTQGQWLQAGLAASTAPWQVVYMHHPPYGSSVVHGSEAALQWPYQQWGADVVLAGHDHHYERIVRNDANHTNFAYFVNGAGGHPTLYNFSTPVAGSQVRYNSDWGAQRVTTSATQLIFEFINRAGAVIDNYTISKPPAGTATIGLLSPTDSRFFLRNSNTAGSAEITFAYGAANAGWLPIAGDWNGDGVDTVGLYRPSTSTFLLRNSNSAGTADVVFVYGPANAGWLPIAGDWNGDGIDSIGVYNPANGGFYLRNALSAGADDAAFLYGPGGSSWQPVTGDWNADRTDSIGLYNSAVGGFYLRNTLSGGADHAAFVYGPAGASWRPLAGDWNGDGRDSVGLYNPAVGGVYLRNAHSGGTDDAAFVYGPGGLGWRPIVGDWNGPGANSAVALAGPDTPGPGASGSNETDHGDDILRTLAARDEMTREAVWSARSGVNSRSWEGLPTIDSIAAGRVRARCALLDLVYAEPLDLL